MSDTSLGSGWWQASDGKWYPPRWEYRIVKWGLLIKKNEDLFQAELQEAGRQGWEAVGIGSPTQGTFYVLMKRPLTT